MAVVTPLYKNKGSTEEVNNYRGISVLPPIAKLFEKLLHKQISTYLNTNNILSNEQHGFRKNHSCESALHELLSQMNTIKSKRLIGLFLFIDFKKAFDSVDPKLLLIKLRKYGFSDTAIALLANYFSNRKQHVKLDEFISESESIGLGVPQGSVLGPLLFLIYINDLAIYLTEFSIKLFADDTTLTQIGCELPELLDSFQTSFKKLLSWCEYNRIDINWTKTKIMFITSKRNVSLPSCIIFEDKSIEVVKKFKLLGVQIDNRLNFLSHVSDLRISINKRIYSIKRLFYLSYKVKLQFFKSFILPYFDYGLSLLIYFPKRAIQKLANTYNFCLFKLLNIKHDIVLQEDFNQLNNKLNEHNIDCFQHRIILKLSRFAFKIVNFNNSPKGLKLGLVRNYNTKSNYNLRNIGEYIIPFKGRYNDFLEKNF